MAQLTNEAFMQHKINGLVGNLQYAAGLAAMVKEEFEMNGTDSLANIDYGAQLNTVLENVRHIFGELDQLGMFTTGFESDDWELPTDI